MNHRNGAGGTQDKQAVSNDRVKVDHKKVSRVWKDGGPKLGPVTIRTLYDPITKLVVLQFEDKLGPVFRATFGRPELRRLIEDIYDSLLEVDLDEAEAAREADKDVKT